MKKGQYEFDRLSMVLILLVAVVLGMWIGFMIAILAYPPA